MKMKRMILIIAMTLALVFGSFGSVYAAGTQVILDFDDLTSSSDQIPEGYAGLEWQTGWSSTTLSGGNYQNHSGETWIYFNFMANPVQTKAYIDFSPLGTDVTFDGAWFGGNYMTGGLYFEGWRDGVLVGTSDTLVIDSSNAYTSTYLAADFGVPVDRVYVCAVREDALDEFSMDDVTYTVPESFSVAVSAMTNGTVTPGVTSAYAGDTVDLTVRPDDGYQLVDGSLMVNGAAIDGTSFVMPEEDVIILAEFEMIPEDEPVIVPIADTDNDTSAVAEKDQSADAEEDQSAETGDAGIPAGLMAAILAAGVLGMGLSARRTKV